VVVAPALSQNANPASANPIRGATLTIREVSHRFDLAGQTLPVLDRISLHIGRGEFVALLGPSGCGKSTLLRLVAGLDMPSAGSLFVEGTAIEGPDPSRVVVFQDPTLYPWRTVWNNVALGLEARGLLRTHRHRIEDALSLVGLTGFANAYPHQLSGGMAQRAALARALVNDPTLLILDEPLGQLDSLTRITMQGELVSLWQRAGFTALLVTHDVEEALFLAGRVIVLSERPAHIKAEIVNSSPYPRHRGDPHLAELRHAVFAHLGLDTTW
jgi:NitT/TauT family transport system ATP-binding protein